MPLQTITAFQDHGVVAQTLTQDVDAARATMARLAQAGINLRAVTDQLKVDGVKLFTESYNQMIQKTGEKTARLVA